MGNMLRGKIIEKCGTLHSFAQKLGISDKSLTFKLTGVYEWKQGEMLKACEILDIPLKQLHVYFF